MVWGSKPVTVRTSIRMTLLGILLAVVSTALIAHEFLRHADVRMACGQRALTFAQTAAWQFSPDRTSADQDLSRACRRLLDSPWVLAVSIRDATGKAIAQAAVADGLIDLLGCGEQDAGRIAPSVQHLMLPATFATKRGPAQLVTTPLDGHILGEGPAEMGLLVQMEPVAGNPARDIRSFVMPVVGMSLLALCLGSWWLRREVVQPIRSLVQVASADAEQERATDRFRRHRDLGAIAQGFSALRTELSSSRRRENTIERRADSRIAEETKRISQDLRRMQRAVWLDGLTGIHNRRFLEERYPAIFQAQRASGRDLSVVMFDMDHFKKLNDTSGHAAGDAILEFMGELLKQCVRSDDFAARYGGDEFVLILPGVCAQEALPIARRICALFEQRAKMMAKVKPVPSMTAGIASLIQHRPADHAELLALADAGLLAAKEAGKRRIQITSGRQALVCRGDGKATRPPSGSTPSAAIL